MFSVTNVIARMLLIFFSSISDFSQFKIFGCSSHCVWSWSHLRPCHYLLSSLHISQSQVSRSAEFSFGGTNFYLIKVFTLILDTLLLTNNLYYLLSFNQCRTGVVSDHKYIFLSLSSLRQTFTFSAIFADMCAANNSKCGI